MKAKIKFNEIIITLNLKGKQTWRFSNEILHTSDGKLPEVDEGVLKERIEDSVLLIEEGLEILADYKKRCKKREPKEEIIRRKMAFIKKYRGLFKRNFDYNRATKHRGWNTIEGQRLVELARKQLKYSDKTVNCDIFNMLGTFYKNNK